MFRNKVVLEANIGGKLYQFFCEADSPIEDVIAVGEIVIREAKKIKEQIEKQQAEAKQAGEANGNNDSNPV